MKRRTKWTVGIFLTLAIALFFIQFFSDIDPIDDSDLRFDEPVIRDERNGAVLLLRALEGTIAPAQARDLPRLGKTFGIRPPGIETHFEVVPRRPAVTANAPVIAAIERAVEAPVFSFAGTTGDERQALSALFDPFIEEAAFVAWADGDVWRARELLELLRKLHARSIERHAGTWGQNWITHPVRYGVPRYLTNLASLAPLSTEEIRRWLADPGVTIHRPGWEENFLRHGYAISTAELRSGWFEPAGPQWALRTERTVAGLAAHTREILEHVDQPFPQVTRRTGLWRTIGDWLGGNATGAYYVRHWDIPVSLALEQGHVERQQTLLRTIRSLLALRLHHRVHGTWPDSADALDPTIWPEDLAPPIFVALDDAEKPDESGVIPAEREWFLFDASTQRWRIGPNSPEASSGTIARD